MRAPIWLKCAWIWPALRSPASRATSAMRNCVARKVSASGMYSPSRASVSRISSARVRSPRPSAATSAKMVVACASGTSAAISSAVTLRAAREEPQFFDLDRDARGIAAGGFEQQRQLRQAELQAGLLRQRLRQCARRFRRERAELHLRRNRGIKFLDALQLGLSSPSKS